jgi:drug/metabolite transporter (DMT)-like permease
MLRPIRREQSAHEWATQPEDGRDNPDPNPLQDCGMTPLQELAGRPRRNLAGVGLMLAGAFLFSVNDALGKWLLADYSVGELLLMRSAAGLILLAPLIRQT